MHLDCFRVSLLGFEEGCGAESAPPKKSIYTMNNSTAMYFTEPMTRLVEIILSPRCERFII